MNMSNVTKVLKTIGTGINKHKPAILTGMGIAAGVTSTVLAVKATPDAIESIKMAEEEKGEKLTKMEVVKATWKHYIPAITTGVTAGVCVVSANAIHSKRSAALATACQISATALNEYKEKTLETVGEEAEKQIREKVVQEHLKNNPVKEDTKSKKAKKDESGLQLDPVITEKGHFLCYDTGGNKYFRSDEVSIREAIVDLNERMNNNEPYVSLNELYSKLSVRGTDVGEVLGWNRFRDGLIEPLFDSAIADNGEPCIVVSYTVMPQYDYHKI